MTAYRPNMEIPWSTPNEYLVGMNHNADLINSNDNFLSLRLGKGTDYYTSKGYVYDDMKNSWGAVNGTLAQDETVSVYGGSSLRCESTGDIMEVGKSSLSIKLTNDSDTVGVWLYCPTQTSIKTVIFYLTADSYASYFLSQGGGQSLTGGYFQEGWNFLLFRKEDFTNTGGASWDDTFTRLKFAIKPETGGTIDCNLGGLILDVKVSEPLMMIEFDDGANSSYYEGFRIMNQRGIVGSTGIVEALVGTAGYIDYPLFRNMVDGGWTVTNHSATHTNLSTLTKEEQRVELGENRDRIVSEGLGDGLQVTYPFGSYNLDTLEVLTEDGYKTARTVGNSPLNNVATFKDSNYIKTCLNMDESTTLVEAKAIVDSCIAKKQLCILLFHGLQTTAGGGYYWAISDFEELMDYIVSVGVRCINREEFYSNLSIS